MWILLFFLACNSNNSSLQSNQLENTIWISKISSDCVDTIKFETNKRVYYYSCEIDYTSKGSYYFKKNTIVLNINEDSHGSLEKWRYKFVLHRKILSPISSEEFLHGKWQLQKNSFDNNYMQIKME